MSRQRRPSRNRVAALVLVATLAGTLAACGTAASSPPPDPALQLKADMYDIQHIEVTWHTAASTKDVDLILSLWAENATMTVGTRTYAGKAEIRGFISKAAPFKAENVWVSETPAQKIKVTANGDVGTLYFECHYIDLATKTVAIVVGSNLDVARINGAWLITKAIMANPELTV